MFSLLDATLLGHFVFKVDAPGWFWVLAVISEVSNNIGLQRKLKALERIGGRFATRAKY